MVQSPSTREGQNSDSSKLIDASSINISDMGTQGGSGGMDGQNQMFAPPDKQISNNGNAPKQRTPRSKPGQQTTATNPITDLNINSTTSWVFPISIFKV